MFKSLNLKNYKAFREITIDFSKNQKENNVKNLISIYGENGSGKSNIADLFTILSKSITTLDMLDKYNEARNQFVHRLDYETTTLSEEFEPYFVLGNYALKNIIDNCKTKNSEGENMVITYEFVLNHTVGEYTLVFNDDDRLIKEELSYLIGQRKGCFFSIEQKGEMIESSFSPSIFKNKTLNHNLEEELDQFWGKHSFLAILSNYSQKINEKFLSKSLSSKLFDVIAYFKHLSILTNNFKQNHAPENLLENLEKGKISVENKDKLKASQKILFTFLTSLYSDIKDVHYAVREEDDMLYYTLMVDKNIGGKLTKLPFKLESKGTQKMLDLLPLILNAVHGETVVIDEIDAGIHDLLMSSVIDSLSDSIEGQLIFTTHDTYLMQVLPKNAVYVIQSDNVGNKSLECLDNFAIKANNNPSRMYLNGAFSGIPYPMSLDFESMLEELEE